MQELQEMPKKGLYLALVILGFVLGIIWGALSIGPYRAMSAAIEADDAEEAWANASKIKRYILIGVVVNVVLGVVRSFAGV